MESFFEIFLELFFQLLGDLVIDAVSRSRSPLVHTVANSLLAIIVAAMLAVLSLLAHPHHVIRDPSVRLAALLILPVLNGFLMAIVGRKLAKQGRIRSEFERFTPALLFSLTFGLMRFFGAK